MVNTSKHFISSTELAEMLGVSRVAVFKWIKSGKIKAVKVGRNYIIDKRNLGGVLEGRLTKKQALDIKRAVRKTVEEYGETLKLLGES